jgi:hypothetical protein
MTTLLDISTCTGTLGGSIYQNPRRVTWRGHKVEEEATSLARIQININMSPGFDAMQQLPSDMNILYPIMSMHDGMCPMTGSHTPPSDPCIYMYVEARFFSRTTSFVTSPMQNPPRVGSAHHLGAQRISQIARSRPP